jgi:Pyrimidine dimer DNA glycosylase
LRIWSLHPKYLDSRGLVALWRETLLAQAVLLGKTKGYTQHPQLDRFRERAAPARLVATYLHLLHDEAVSRGYNFTAEKIRYARSARQLTVTRGQLEFEWQHLMIKLKVRDPARALALTHVRRPQPHPIFRVVPGAVAIWEKPRKLAGKRPQGSSPRTRPRP